MNSAAVGRVRVRMCVCAFVGSVVGGWGRGGVRSPPSDLGCPRGGGVVLQDKKRVGVDGDWAAENCKA